MNLRDIGLRRRGFGVVQSFRISHRSDLLSLKKRRNQCLGAAVTLLSLLTYVNIEFNSSFLCWQVLSNVPPAGRKAKPQSANDGNAGTTYPIVRLRSFVVKGLLSAWTAKNSSLAAVFRPVHPAGSLLSHDAEAVTNR